MLEPDVRLLKLNSDAEPEAAGELGVSGIPALLLFKDGEIVARTAGAMATSQIVSWTRQALSARAAGGRAA
jgi:thioredoxin 2